VLTMCVPWAACRLTSKPCVSGSTGAQTPPAAPESLQGHLRTRTGRGKPGAQSHVPWAAAWHTRAEGGHTEPPGWHTEQPGWHREAEGGDS